MKKTEEESMKMTEKERTEKFTEIYNEYKPLIDIYLRTYVANDKDREDIVADTFLKVFKFLDSFDCGKAQLTTWIHKIAHNQFIDTYRNGKVNGSAVTSKNADLVNDEDEKSNDMEPINHVTASAGIEDFELHRRIRRAIRTLKPLEKRLAILRLIKEYEYQEIAEMLEMPLNSVKAMLFRAKENLQIALRQDYKLIA
jgi:RNA polymerase sigma-70 factor, ECF subfamily